jgi:hypothetical protein
MADTGVDGPADFALNVVYFVTTLIFKRPVVK